MTKLVDLDGLKRFKQNSDQQLAQKLAGKQDSISSASEINVGSVVVSSGIELENSAAIYLGDADALDVNWLRISKSYGIDFQHRSSGREMHLGTKLSFGYSNSGEDVTIDNDGLSTNGNVVVGTDKVKVGSVVIDAQHHTIQIGNESNKSIILEKDKGITCGTVNIGTESIKLQNVSIGTTSIKLGNYYSSIEVGGDAQHMTIGTNRLSVGSVVIEPKKIELSIGTVTVGNQNVGLSTVGTKGISCNEISCNEINLGSVVIDSTNICIKGVDDSDPVMNINYEYIASLEARITALENKQ